MKVIVRRNWADASKAWIDVQTYTGLKLPPSEMQYKLSFMDKDSVPAQMIVTSDGASWVDGLGGGYRGKTVLNMTIEEPQRGAGSEGGGGEFAFDGANMSVDEHVVTFKLTLNGEAISGSAFVYVYVTDYDGIPQYFNEDWEGIIPASNGGFFGFALYTGEQQEITLSNPSGGDPGDFYLNAIMPSGAIVTSPAIHFEPEIG